MITYSQAPIRFALTGKVQNFKVGKHQRIRHFDLVFEQARLRFKVPKALHRRWQLQLSPGLDVEVSGLVVVDGRKRKLNLNLQAIRLLSPPQDPTSAPPMISDFQDLADLRRTLDGSAPGVACRDGVIAPAPQGLAPGRPAQAPAQDLPQTILICKASSCWKRGGAQIHQRLQEAVEREGAQAPFQIQTVGCMGRCKSGPNVKILPDRITLRRVDPQQVESLLARC